MLEQRGVDRVTRLRKLREQKLVRHPPKCRVGAVAVDPLRLLVPVRDRAVGAAHDDRVVRQVHQASPLLELDVQPTALGDVLYLGDEDERRPAGIPHERDRQARPYDLSVLTDVALVHPVAGALVREDLLDVGEVGVEIVRVRDVLEGALEQFLLGVAGQLTQRPVDPQPAAVGCDERHSNRRRVKREPERVRRFRPRRMP